tara:strand:- start:2780 stop:2953 length:174 start_codon:yes stop_codon:yes gene_type:complete
MMKWTDADDIAYCEAAAETDWDFKDIQFLKSQNPQPPKKSSDTVQTNTVKKEKSIVE